MIGDMRFAWAPLIGPEFFDLFAHFLLSAHIASNI